MYQILEHYTSRRDENTTQSLQTIEYGAIEFISISMSCGYCSFDLYESVCDP